MQKPPMYRPPPQAVSVAHGAPAHTTDLEQARRAARDLSLVKLGIDIRGPNLTG